MHHVLLASEFGARHPVGTTSRYRREAHGGAVMDSLRSREIEAYEIEFLASFLSDGLGETPKFYAEILYQLARRTAPSRYPRFGYVLESDWGIVGAILLIFSEVYANGEIIMRCHVTSWYVKPEFRTFAAVFFARALKDKNVTYINISARPAASKIIEAQGFKLYSAGQFIAPTFLNINRRRRAATAKVPPFPKEIELRMDPRERALLDAHASFGCLVFCCSIGERAYPFVFQRRWLKGLIPVVQLIYCRGIDELVSCMPEVARFLSAKGVFAIRIDANARIDGVKGRYYEGVQRRWFKGENAPRLGDLAYTQAVLTRYPRYPRPRREHVVARSANSKNVTSRLTGAVVGRDLRSRSDFRASD